MSPMLYALGSDAAHPLGTTAIDLSFESTGSALNTLQTSAFVYSTIVETRRNIL